MLKRIFSLLFLQSLFLGNIYSSNTLTLKVNYKPETKYTQTIDQTSHTELSYSGSDDYLKRLKEKGVQNPTISNIQSKIEAVIKTDKLIDGTRFPLYVEFVKTTSNNGKKIIPDGTIIYGYAMEGSMPKLDSIVSENLDSTMKKTYLLSMQSLFSQIPFPQKQELKVGDCFSTETPLSIPVSSIIINMNILTNYKLLNIINGIGNFEITQTYTLNSSFKEYPIEAIGSGKGQLFYDSNKDFYSYYSMDSELFMNLKIKDLSIDIKSKSGYVQSIDISKNNDANR